MKVGTTYFLSISIRKTRNKEQNKENTNNTVRVLYNWTAIEVCSYLGLQKFSKHI